MSLATGVAFLVASSTLIVLTLLMILRLGFGRLESRVGIERDGPKRSAPAPVWCLADLDGAVRGSPSGSHWQLLLFADHDLASFPNLVAAANRMHASIPDLEVVALMRREAELDNETIAALRIAVPIVPVDQAFYNRHNVRVTPYGILLDPDGTVRWASVANYEEQLRRELHLAREAVASVRTISISKEVLL